MVHRQWRAEKNSGGWIIDGVVKLPENGKDG